MDTSRNGFWYGVGGTPARHLGPFTVVNGEAVCDSGMRIKVPPEQIGATPEAAKALRPIPIPLWQR